MGSCFADKLGRGFVENRFRATVNPFGVMYNPASILHTVEKCSEVRPRVAVFTLGTNHVYILKETGEIVDNCQKRPQRLFEERELSVDECAGYLQKAINLLKSQTVASGSSEGTLKVIITVSPIRYAKYGYHGSQLSKATLQLAADRLVKANPGVVSYFPAYEIVLDELRDYRFYADDMLHMSGLTVDYIWERFLYSFITPDVLGLMNQIGRINKGVAHRPFDPQSEDYQRLVKKMLAEIAMISHSYPMINFSAEEEKLKSLEFKI